MTEQPDNVVHLVPPVPGKILYWQAGEKVISTRLAPDAEMLNHPNLSDMMIVTSEERMVMLLNRECVIAFGPEGYLK